MAARTMIHAADVDRVGDGVAKAINSLVERGVQPTGVDELREAVRLLEEIRVSAVSHPLSPVLAAALRDLVPRAARAGELLDSAAAFYRGWLQVSPPAEDYTPEGAWASPAAPSSL